MNKKWKEKTVFEKSLDIISFIALCIWLIFEILERSNKFANAEMWSCISLIVVCVCEAISFWKVKRSLSYVAIGGAVLLLAVVILTKMLSA